MLAHYLVFLGSKLGSFESVDSNQRLNVRDLNESLLQWERVLLCWVLHWQRREYDNQWLRQYLYVKADLMGRRLPGNAPVADLEQTYGQRGL
jgi:hypothetical protein